MSMFQEFKRRKVFQVAAVYAVVAWLLIQVVDVVSEPLKLPGWFATVVIVLLGIGFPIAVILAWAFDLTPQGIRAAADTAPAEPRTMSPVGLLGAVSQVLVLVAIVFLVADEYLFVGPDGSSSSSAVQDDMRAVRFVLDLPVGEALGIDDQSLSLAISPDGSRVVFATLDGPNQYLWHVRNLGQLGSLPLRGTDVRFETPVFSPDGEWVAFNDLSQGSLVRVPVLGGAPVQISALSTSALRGASWGEDNTIVFGTQAEGLWLVSGDGGDATRLTRPEAGTRHRWPDWLPGQEGLLFTVSTDQHSQVAVLDRKSGLSRIVIPEGTSPRYLQTGHIAYAAGDGTLRVVPFDVDTRSVTGPAMAVLDELAVGAFGGAHYAVARSGTMVYAAGLQLQRVSLGSRRSQAVWVDEQGVEQAARVDACRCIEASVSPDGTKLAVSAVDDSGQTADIWIWSFERSMFVRLTFENEPQRTPVWSPDSRYIAFRAFGDGIRVRAADGSGASSLVVPDPTAVPVAWLPERGIMYASGTSNANRQIYLAPGEPGGSPVPVGEQGMNWPSVSPDGRWIAYENSSSGRKTIFVRPFPDTESGRWQVSTGTEPRWSADGSLLYFLSGGQLMAVSVDDTEAFRFGRPRSIAELGRYMEGATTYATATEGRKVLFLKYVDPPPEQANVPSGGNVVVVLNWADEIRRMQP